ncbi:uncharacterized protein TM35_000251150 [Trypanosoma theileri]|uniref:Uncharacterized protein n=1 Tax=Trypanosoma theileri TaxID=67003 RepID=A0A1X0NRK9_9TRYP|nr:uncharacterized protein TM35_000251150 [Trypanosoma theileri]ORC86819.1 hypothetical protein TM35_000251150 [Trypanosoma theileri]
MPEAYIVRFKVITLECASLPNGQQYTITYRRRETCRSTPCYAADGGVVDFSSMPEGSAIVHFKPGGVRFHPKWITFRIEEFVRGQPRKTVAETQLDCAAVLGVHNITAATTRRVSFDMYGTPAVMVVALLVYPNGHPPLSFAGIVPDKNSARAGGEGERRLRAGGGEVKKFTRGEAMTLLISLETMLERRRAETAAGGSAQAESPLQRRVAELEERRRCITGVEGMATTVVTKRVVDLVAAQFVALSRKYRGNYVGEVAAYLRQMAVASGIPLTADISTETTLDVEAARERLQRINGRIDTLVEQTRKLEEEREALGRLQGRADVTNEVCAILTKLETLQSQMQLLIKSRVALEDAVRGNGFNDTPVGREVQEIRARIKLLAGEEEQLQGRIRRMTAVAATHVLKWARSKNPPKEDVRADFSSLFAPITQQEKDIQKDLTTEQRQKIMEALSNVAKPSAPPVHSHTSSEMEESPRNPHAEMFGAKGLPSMNDFAASEKNASRDAEEKGSPSSPSPPPNQHLDPYIHDLGRDMFAPKSGGEDQENKKNKPSKTYEFNFGSAPDDESDPDDAKGDRYGMFGANVQESSPDTSEGLPAVQITSIDDDPMYDFRPPADVTNNKPVLFEINESSFSQPFEQATSSKLPAYTFTTDVNKFSESDDGTPRVLPTYNFGSDNASKSNENNTVTRMPTYNFGS